MPAFTFVPHINAVHARFARNLCCIIAGKHLGRHY
jgi:hypothetical protein